MAGSGSPPSGSAHPAEASAIARDEPLTRGAWRTGTRGWPASTVGLLAAALAAALLLGTAVPVPDTSSPPIATMFQWVDDGRSLGQSFQAERDGLHRIEMVLAVISPVGDQPLRISLREDGHPELLRSARVARGRLPVPVGGDPSQFLPGHLAERWFAMDFEPISNSAGRRYYLGLEGPGIPFEGSVKAAAFFHNQYALGQAYIDGQPVNAHLVFRAYSYAPPIDALARIIGNLISQRPGILGQPPIYGLLVVLYVVLATALLRLTRRLL